MTAAWDPTKWTPADDASWPRPLTDIDRTIGCLALNLITHWRHWVKRRVEKVELVGPATSRHRISIDFRVRPWFPTAGPEGGQTIYVPLTRLGKYPVLNFDLRDEAERAVPLVTRRKSAAIAAGALSALAAQLVMEDLTDLATTRGCEAAVPQRFRQIEVPGELERYFYEVAYGYPEEPQPDRRAAGRLAEEFIAPGSSDNPKWRRPADWRWELLAPLLWRADADEAEWRSFLAPHTSFFGLLRDFAEFFLVCIPIQHEIGARRIVKLRYQQHIEIPRLRSTVAARKLVSRLTAHERYTAVKDTLEGLPRDIEWERRGFRPHAASARGAERGISWFAKVSQAIGWVPKPVFFDAPAASQGGTYHFEFEAPPGLQIRQASLTAAAPNEAEPHVTRVVGAQSLRRVQLYAGNLPPSSWGRISIHLKVAPNTLVRGAWFGTFLSTFLLFFYFWKLEALVDPAQDNFGATLAALLLVPGLMTGLLTRGEEHPITTDLLFGLRCLVGLAAMCPVVGAVLLVAAPEWEGLWEAWALVLGTSTALLFVLSVTWLLAARRRPDGSMP